MSAFVQVQYLSLIFRHISRGQSSSKSFTCREHWFGWFGFVVRGESPGCRLISTASMLEWLRNLLPHHSQGSSTERWSRNTVRVVTARVFLTSPFILNNSVETAAPFNVVSHPRRSLRDWGGNSTELLPMHAYPYGVQKSTSKLKRALDAVDRYKKKLNEYQRKTSRLKANVDKENR